MEMLPEEGKPDKHGGLPPRAARSQSRSHVTPYYIWGTLALLAAGFAGGGLFLHLAQLKGEDSVVTAPLMPDPLSSLQTPAREVLLAPEPELSAELKRSFLGKPDQLCDELRSLGLGNPGWRRAPFSKDRWQCASDLVPLTTPSVDYGSTTLFFLLRGPSENSIDYLRLKLVVEDPRQIQIGLDAVWLVIDALALRYGWTVPEVFREAVSGFRQLETTHRGVRLSVSPEDPDLTGDPLARQRLNIILDFGEPDLIRPADRFEKAPPLESGWSVKAPNAQAAE
ncbi:hypothetical protein FMN63_27360 [Stappia sp. BW2]|jgi:hypothetical protein|uniref:DUF6030 family protein n=1 Tax=Stappia sp. BW2 TaxID=2592622 RepID=UPI0011DE96A7|nr:DUF6030 family protein [Stappia sp. BW2]TYC66059.1 hypothetical protein FMN63_27360 [Stappia sp. BW2]